VAYALVRWLQYENILNLDLEMPERTTHDYDGMMLPADAQYAEVRPTAAYR
jgi:hypothetical protein